jgi:cytochrome b
MAGLVAWLVAAAVAARVTSRRADGPRTAAWLSLVSFGVLTASILWGLFGATRHGAPPVPPAASPAVDQPAVDQPAVEREAAP